MNKTEHSMASAGPIESSERARSDVNLLPSAFGRQSNRRRRRLAVDSGFTLIETLVAISLLTVAIVAPMSLVTQSLSTAVYARDQVTSYNLAQEGIEALRTIRDGNVLANALYSEGRDLLDGIPIGTAFTIDARESTAVSAIASCAGACPPLQTDGTLYGYEDGWTNTYFTRTLFAAYVGPASINDGQDAIRISVTVTWRTSNNQTRSFTIYENMYRWVDDGVAAD